ncbi:transcriptional regulator NrdR [Effusibacillus lacus]|uniref:Transcriptional repressor NrdR n=1 Tax=Effusibacillus lacus TaxID=1348429 RepID=A0A292YD07_9BACL|nr:transcriptional regulator NrdR [Effusibacillus lacus]TCS68416.1 transcriptional repressor NrdR [Effusibacillus lacus]GAX89672.1 transcriptional regulator NrdR [Effusibacillus lacus]
MRCPYCHHTDSRVLESRSSEDHSTIRRRRECPSCMKRFTTYEKIEMAPLLVVKKDNRREEFSRDKLLRGIMKACEKRPVAVEEVERLVEEVEREVRSEYDKEVPAEAVGEKVMEKLRDLDGVAYVRFASVYRQFRDVESFAQEVLNLLDGKKMGGKQ